MPRKVKAAALVHPADRKQQERKSHKVVTKSPPAYDPEQPFVDSEVISSESRYKMMRIDRKALESGNVSVRGSFAVMVYQNNGRTAEAVQRKGGKWTLGFRDTTESDRPAPRDGGKLSLKIVRVADSAAFKKLVESKEWATSKIMESAGYDPFNYGDTWSSNGLVGPPNNEFIPLMGGPFSKQLYMYDYLDAQAKGFWSKNHDPFSAAIVRLKRSYTIGKGVKLLFRNADCQKAWGQFEKRSRFQQKLRDDVETLVWGGEIMTEKIKDSDGKPTIKQWDPSTCWEIVGDPANVEDPHYFHFQFPTQWQLTYKSGDIGSEYIINDVPADRMIHVKVNVTPGEKRGRADLYPVLSWNKRWRDYMNAKVVKAQMEQSWSLDISVDGNAGDVQQIADQNPVNVVPPAGSTRVHNKDIEYAVIQPTASSTAGRDDVADQIKNVIAIGAGIAPEWLGESAAGSTKETARTKEGPASRNIEDRQMVVEDYIRQIADYVLVADSSIPKRQARPASLSKVKAALQARDWKAVILETTALMMGSEMDEPTDTSFEVIFPEADTDDRTAKIDDILKAESAGILKHERVMEMIAKELGITNFDAIEEMQDIQAERDQGSGNGEWDIKDETDPKDEKKPEPASKS